MTKAIDIIKDEHRSMGAVIKGLQQQLAAARDAGGEPDFHLVGAMLDYIEAFPDLRHHPKEDEYLFRYLRMRSAEAVPVLDRLEAEHARCAELLADLRAKLEAAREGAGLVGFSGALDAYAEFMWRHMATEEEVVLPLAEAQLTGEDWAAIDLAFAANRGSHWE